MNTAKGPDIGPITNRAIAFFQVLKWLSPMTWIGKSLPLLKNRSDLSPEEVNSTEFTRRRARTIEYYMIGCVVTEILLCVVVLWPREANGLSRLWVSLVVAIATIRILEILQVTVNVAVFDRLKGRPDKKVASFVRLVVLSFVNFLELCVCFGLVYASNWHQLKGAGQPATGFYLSAITQLTIGFGDVYPTGYLRAFSAFQGIISLLFAALVFSRFVGTLPQIHAILDGDDERRHASLSANQNTQTPIE